MRKSRFTEEQIVEVLKRHPAGTSAHNLCRKLKKLPAETMLNASTLKEMSGKIRTPGAVRIRLKESASQRQRVRTGVATARKRARTPRDCVSVPRTVPAGLWM